MPPTVSVLILNYRQGEYVPHCVAALMRQTYQNLELYYIDNASHDGSAAFVREHYPCITVIENSQNLFFSKAHNQAILRSSGEYVLPLNVDLLVAPTYVAEMVAAIELDQHIGMVSGKLLQMDSNLKPLDPPVIDSTGLWCLPEQRHFDRGSLEKDVGQYERVEYIFGPSGAAPLYRRTMLDDIAFEREYFDEDFVIYREDVDLAWRAQLLGWRGLYTPRAIAYHVRRVRPTDKRQSIAAALNLHSVRNRFLMRIKNQSWRNALRFFLPVLWRDVQVIGYVLLREHSSLPAFVQIAKLLPRTLHKRRHIMQRKRVSDTYIAGWFAKTPVAYPYPAERPAS